MPSRQSTGRSSAAISRTGIGLVGCGWIAEIAHVETLLRSKRGRLVAATDPDPVRRDWIAHRAPAARLLGLDDLLNDAAVEAVVVAIPTPDLAAVAAAAFDAGKHVYVEKPLALDPREGAGVVRSWRASDRVGMIGYNFRRSPVALAAGATIAAGEIGELIEIQSRFLWASGGVTGWRADPSRGGGALLDLCPHHIDLIAALAGAQVRRVRCTSRDVRTPGDTVAMELTLATDVRASVLASYAAGANSNRLSLIGTEGLLVVDLHDPLPRAVLRAPGRGARLSRLGRALSGLHPARLLRSPGHEPSFAASLEAFLEAVRAGEAVEPSPAHGLHTLEVVEAARSSATNGGVPVEVPRP